MNNELKFLLTTYIDSIEDLENLCLNKDFFNTCKENTYLISKHFLTKYKVDYKDPNNFIYKFNNVNINDYKKDSDKDNDKYNDKYNDKDSYKDNDKDNGKYKLGSIFRLYMNAYNLKEINCEGKGISSFPIYPNMKRIYCSKNNLTTFPVQPKMVDFFGSNNKLISFPVQPNMEYFEGYNNQLTSFETQPKMEFFNGLNNKLVSLPVQPNMEYCYGNPGICYEIIE